MTVKIQISDRMDFSKTLIDTMVNWKNIYGVDVDYNPIDLNSGLDLTKLSFSSGRFNVTKLYYYRVKYRDHNLKWSDWSNITSFNVTSNAMVGLENEIVPTVYGLEQNFPNPFNPITKIHYQLPKNNFVTLKIYDVLGNEIITLVNEIKAAGKYQSTFDANNLSSGIYFYKIQAGDFIDIKKMILMK